MTTQNDRVEAIRIEEQVAPLLQAPPSCGSVGSGIRRNQP